MDDVKDIMTRTVHTIEPEATLEQAAARMNDLAIGALPVRNGDHLVGMITDRDITVRATAQGLDPARTSVRDAMTQGVIFCFQDQAVQDAAELMEKYRIRRLPVLSRENQLVGMVSLDEIAVNGDDAGLVGEVLEQMARKPQPQAPTFERIVVPLDGSELAEQVLPYVEVLAKRLGSQLTLLRAVTPFEGFVSSLEEPDVHAQSGGHAIATIAPISEEARSDALQYLTAIQARLQSKGITAEYEYPDEEPGLAIVQRARHLGADLIAMTTHGRGGLSRAVHGSVADDVLRHAPCAVLLVRTHQI